jgi:hypothetical protein
VRDSLGVLLKHRDDIAKATAQLRLDNLLGSTAP